MDLVQVASAADSSGAAHQLAGLADAGVILGVLALIFVVAPMLLYAAHLDRKNRRAPKLPPHLRGLENRRKW